MLDCIGPAKCQWCGREWTAALEDWKTEWVECPDCHHMTRVVPPQNNKEASGTSTNSAMPKLPELEECLSQLDFAEGDPVTERVVEGVKVVYDFIARQLLA